MNVDVIDVIGVIVFRTGPDIAFVVPIVFGGWAHSDHEEVSADVELSLLVEEKVAQVWLDNELAALFARCDLLADRFKTWMHGYALTAVWVLSWFHDPYVFTFAFSLLWSSTSYELSLVKILYPHFILPFDIISLGNELIQRFFIFHKLKVFSQVMKQSVFVPEHIIEPKVVMHCFRWWYLAEIKKVFLVSWLNLNALDGSLLVKYPVQLLQVFFLHQILQILVVHLLGFSF